MHFSRQVSRLLDQEHRSLLDLLGRIEQAVVRTRRWDPALAGLVGQFGRALEHDIERHFCFEEEALFPRMAQFGDGAMAELLTQEHQAIRALAAQLLPLARAASGGEIDVAGWEAFRRDALEMVEYQVSHIQKETMALLPLLDDLLDEDLDRELAFSYAA